MEKSFHPSTPHLVSDLIEIGSHDDSHRRNLASLETISLIAFALRIRTWEKPSSSSSSYLYIHRGVLSADRISIFLPSEILFNRLRNSNVARLEFRLVHCTSATSLHRNFSLSSVDANPLPRRVLVRRSTPFSSLPFGIRTLEGCA